jgi:hypothetical protein
MGRKILGVIVGLVGGFAVIVMLQAAGQVLWPMPQGLDPRDRDAIVAVIRGMPAGFLWWTALSWLGGTFAGTFIASRVTRDPWVTWPALTVEAGLLAIGALNVAVLSYPAWFWVVGLSAFPLGAFAGMRLARSGMEGAGEEVGE